MMVQRLKTAKEGWFWLAKMVYLFTLPFLLFIGVVTLYALHSPRAEAKIAGLPLFSLLVWVGVMIPVAVFVYGIFSRRRLLKSITTSLRSAEYFNPDATYEMYHEGDGKYLGIDINNGTILYVHKIRKGEVDVVPLTMDDWINREVEGKMLRIYTKLPQLPRIEIATPWAQRWYDSLGAMEFNRRTTPHPFASYVGNRLAKLERDHQIQIPRFA
ncbi:plasmid IncI1-type surface exclusion protein ExcA [Pseudomonas sp. AA4]|uniref:plasmid IncI1-type surface exclusion protein ExcA n=2 Tax=unclassified Pseudomonas TaxID=196821 RepID=UPI002B3D9F5E|nr:plasmid IncI1-type surface exclusion protein ExcA [Pseudomonas sp. AA4]MEB0222201.1 plasmid IncI1-type surface exclusion protein ExcA [Pseudomonas sp. AB12(2023)]